MYILGTKEDSIQQTNNTSFRSIVHTYFKSLGYKIKVHQQLEMLSVLQYTSSEKK